MAQQKVIKVGNSLGVTLPKSFVEKQQLKAGQDIYVDTNLDLLQVSTTTISTRLTPEFKKWLDTFNKKYKNALSILAEK